MTFKPHKIPIYQIEDNIYAKHFVQYYQLPPGVCFTKKPYPRLNPESEEHLLPNPFTDPILKTGHFSLYNLLCYIYLNPFLIYKKLCIIYLKVPF